VIQIVSYGCNCGYECSGPFVSELMADHVMICGGGVKYQKTREIKELTKEELKTLYKWLEHQHLPYDNPELKVIVDKIQSIAESPDDMAR